MVLIAGIVTAIVRTGVQASPDIAIWVVLIVGALGIALGVGDELIEELKIDRVTRQPQ